MSPAGLGRIEQDERDNVELPLVAQLTGMDWQYLEGDEWVPELPESDKIWPVTGTSSQSFRHQSRRLRASKSCQNNPSTLSSGDRLQDVKRRGIFRLSRRQRQGA